MVNKRLMVNLAGLNLENPTILASGILGYTAQSFRSIVEGGAGAIVTKSIGLEPQVGYPNPTVVQAEFGLINAMGLPNPGINEYTNEIHRAKSVLDIPLIVSIFGFSVEDYTQAAQKAATAGADALELNVSCPHVKGTGSEIGQDPKALSEVVKEVKAAVCQPVFVKLSPNVTDIAAIGDVAAEAGADALTVINTVKAMAIDLETALPILGNKRGGLSGPAIKPIALRCVYDIYERVKIPIIGCGGVSNWRDAMEFFFAGSSAVQIGTAVALESPKVFQSITQGVASYLSKKGVESLSEIVGLAHKDKAPRKN